MYETDWEHAAAGVCAFHLALHPIFIVGPFIDYHDQLAFFEIQFVVVVSIAVVQGSAALSLSRLKIEYEIRSARDRLLAVHYRREEHSRIHCIGTRNRDCPEKRSRAICHSDATLMSYRVSQRIRIRCLSNSSLRRRARRSSPTK